MTISWHLVNTCSRASGPGVRLHDVVRFRWEMVPVGGGEAVGGGVDVFVLQDGRVRTDYQLPDL
jgi:hypothetical protein